MSKLPKFRAWDKQYKQMVNVTMILFDTEEIDHDNNLGEPKSIEHFELMRSSGLTDKNGVEIYEGDISDEGVVVWHEEYLGFFVENKEKLEELTPLYDFNWVEVLGNIHQNPELLKP
jgi:uncharacterized phage protein (TIGR01671 family)